jgi:hypothetical protein
MQLSNSIPDGNGCFCHILECVKTNSFLMLDLVLQLTMTVWYGKQM